MEFPEIKTGGGGIYLFVHWSGEIRKRIKMENGVAQNAYGNVEITAFPYKDPQTQEDKVSYHQKFPTGIIGIIKNCYINRDHTQFGVRMDIRLEVLSGEDDVVIDIPMLDSKKNHTQYAASFMHKFGGIPFGANQKIRIFPWKRDADPSKNQKAGRGMSLKLWDPNKKISDMTPIKNYYNPVTDLPKWIEGTHPTTFEKTWDKTKQEEVRLQFFAAAHKHFTDNGMLPMDGNNNGAFMLRKEAQENTAAPTPTIAQTPASPQVAQAPVQAPVAAAPVNTPPSAPMPTHDMNPVVDRSQAAPMVDSSDFDEMGF
jgi:hypothetical protein